MKLVTGEFRVLGPLFLFLESGPLEDETEFGQVRVSAQGGEQGVCLGQGVVAGQLGGGDVLDLELLALGKRCEEFLLGK